MVNININGKDIVAKENMTILEAAKANDIHIPTLCYLEGVSAFGGCRICVVEVEGARNLQAACKVKIRDGMKIKTNSKRALDTRRMNYQLLISDHDINCLSCVRNNSCELQALGRELGIKESEFESVSKEDVIDISESLTRNPNKCILCRRCVATCEKIQKTSVIKPINRGFKTKIGPYFDKHLGDVDCAFCGQCSVVCPVGAISETSHEQRVLDALEDKDKYTIVQVAPAVRVAIAEEFGDYSGKSVTGKLANALSKIGFDNVFDTNWSADLTIMEEGTEFLSRVTDLFAGKKAVLPMLTSCSPGWVKFIENHYSNQLEHLSTCKSPHTMFGAVLKSYYAEKIGVPAENIFVISVMPCTAKKTEIARKEMQNDGNKNVDAVITTRELANIIKTMGIDFMNLEDREFDQPLGFSSGAADIFGLTGGVMEAALRTVYELVTGRELPFPDLHVKDIVGFDQIKTATIEFKDVKEEFKFLEGFKLNIAVTSGLDGADKLMKEIDEGKSPYHFIEVMGCPGGCIMGGGQPRTSDFEKTKNRRLKSLYGEDERKKVRKSHENPAIIEFYNEWGAPGGHKSHEYLHTTYVQRGRFNENGNESFTLEK